MDMDLYDILDLLGYFLRVLGALVFGVGIGWLVQKIVKDAAKYWQLVAAIMLGLFGTFLVLAGWGPSSSTVGAFGLGVGAGILIWGLAIKAKKE